MVSLIFCLESLSNDAFSSAAGGAGRGGRLVLEGLEMYPMENAEIHRTEMYELVKNKQTPVLRRSATFFLGLRAEHRAIDFLKDDIRVVFLFGE